MTLDLTHDPKDGAGEEQIQAEPLNSDVSKNNHDQEFEF